ncbi:uncharacterized protein TNCV_2632041 [Trichonephila clavipes]|nr:uncharacterized protein TNCV_2632041 [Trichonephila clavipes]
MDETEAGAEQVWICKKFLLDGTHITNIKSLSCFLQSLNANQKFDSENVRNADILPFCKWEDLVEKKLLAFLVPQHLFPPLIEMTRIVSIEIDKWIKDLSLILERSAEIAHTSQRYFQWNSLAKIDRVKTARMLNNEGSNLEDLYLLAVHYRLMDDVHIDNYTRIRLKEVAEHEYCDRLAIPTEFWRESAGEFNIFGYPLDNRVLTLHLNLERHSVEYADLYC